MDKLYKEMTARCTNCGKPASVLYRVSHGVDTLCETCARVKNATPDPVNSPDHYTAGKVECIDALESATVNLTGIEAVCTANAIKYLWRWKQKNGAEDLKKAQWYLERLIKTVER